MMPLPIRIAFSAMGDHAIRAHLKHFLRSTKCQVIGGFDPGLEMDKEWREENGLGASFKQYDSFIALVADRDVDAVLIASPDRFHLSQLQVVIRSGKHTFCEKPLCTDEKELPELQSILSEASEKRLSIASCHPRRFDPPYVWLKEELPHLTRKYGKILKISLDFSYHEPSALKGELHSGSLLLDHANHEIDYVNFLLGRSGTNITRLTDSFDHYALSGVRDDGVILNFHGSRRLSSRIYPEKIHVRFDRGELEINTYNPRLSRIVDHEQIVHHTGATTAPDGGLLSIDHPVTDYEKRFHDVNDDWLESITHGRCGYLAMEDMLYNAALSVGFGKGVAGSLRLEKDGRLVRSKFAS